MHKHLDELLQKEMSRKEFLTTIGFGLGAIFGLSTILGLLNSRHSSAKGYGSSSYGGKR